MNEPIGWVLYDDSCGACRRWIPFWRDTLGKRGFDIAPLQSAWARAALQESERELVRDLRLLLRDGRQVVGADVYRFVMKRIGWAYPLYLLASAPLLRSAFDAGYRAFADHRHRISRACGWSPPRD